MISVMIMTMIMVLMSYYYYDNNHDNDYIVFRGTQWSQNAMLMRGSGVFFTFASSAEQASGTECNAGWSVRLLGRAFLHVLASSAEQASGNPIC